MIVGESVELLREVERLEDKKENQTSVSNRRRVRSCKSNITPINFTNKNKI